MIYTVKIEQTYAYPKRMKYVSKTDSFIEKDCDSLSYVRMCVMYFSLTKKRSHDM
jgi:hypothetical protein